MAGFIIDDVNAEMSDSEALLRDIDSLLHKISKEDGLLISQSSLHDIVDELEGTPTQRRSGRTSNNTTDRQETTNQRRQNAYRRGEDRFDTSDMRKRGRISARKFFDDLTDELESSFIEGLFGSRNPIRDALRQPLNDFAKSLNVDIKDLGTEIGRRLGQQASNAFKDSGLGRQLTQQWQGVVNDISNQSAQLLRNATDALNDPEALSRIVNGGNGGRSRNRNDQNNRDLTNESIDNISDALNNLSGSDGPLNEAGEVLSDASDMINSSANNMSGELQNAVGDLGKLSSSTQLANQSTAQLTSELSAAGPELAGLAGAAGPLLLLIPILELTLWALERAIQEWADAFQPAKEGLDKFIEQLKKSGTRVFSQTARNIELAQKRLEDDARTLIETPFKILEDAANRVLDTWDEVLNTISSTQQYNKAQVQELWASYSERLKNENLTSVISSTDIMKNLESILQKGLSGKVAEEFAYTATLLNNAIPTQDFFQYAETFASLAANYVKMGMDEEKAIGFASKELKSFASNVLYASRELAGGFTTSLSNASSLFEDSAKIAMTSGNIITSGISGVLTSVSAIVGSIAPDLASGVVDAVVKAALGGNSNEITALRAMTSVGASNTAFLKALSKDPKSVFVELFSNLADMQQMSADNFMEVAEALSSVFGISMDAFARVDFSYLADKISEMEVSFDSLDDNINLLKSGQTISTAEQLRMQQINEYMLEEGLAYVLDNEVAREVQRHMWEEQLAQEIEENTFSVDLAGAAAELLKGLVEVVNNILQKLGGPLVYISGLELTATELASLGKDIENVLEAQVVGSGNSSAFHNLTTSGTSLDLIERYPELITLKSNYTGRSTGGSNITDNNLFLTPEQEDHIFNPPGRPASKSSVSSVFEESSLSSVSDASASSSKSSSTSTPKGKYRTGVGVYYNWNPIAKTLSDSFSTLFKEVWSSGDWRTAASYNAIWDSELTAIGKSDQNDVQDFLDTMQDYTKEMAAISASGGGTAKAAAKARESAENKYLSQSELEDVILNTPVEEEMSYENWIASASEYGITNLGQTLSEYGLTITDVTTKFQQYQAQAEGKAEHARQLHEVQFWENVEEYNNNYFPNHFENEFLRKDWMENWETAYLTPIRDDLHQLLTDWEDYYIHHTAYTDATANAFESAIELAGLEKDEMGDSVLALAKALTENSNWLQENQELLKDPVVHANVLLSQILVVTEAIMQQNNSAATTSAIPTTLLGLGTGGL